MSIEKRLIDIESKLEEQLALSKSEYDLHKLDQIDLKDLFNFIWFKKKFILACLVLASLSFIFYALSKPNIYQANAILMPAFASSSGQTLGLPGQLGGIASLAGINLSGGKVDKAGLALEILKSRSFIENFIAKYELLVPLMAATSWDEDNNLLVLNQELYDPHSQAWRAENKKSLEPSPWKAYKQFKGLLAISRDVDTGMITLSLSYFSPSVAKRWLKLLVSEINDTMRENDKKDAQQSIKYLKEELQATNLTVMQDVFYQLIEEQTKTMMLTQISDEYVLKTIEPPNVSEEKVAPKRALIVILGTLIGGFFSILILLVDFIRKANNNSSEEAK